MSRKDAREVAFKLIFEYVFNREVKRDVVDEYTNGMDADDVSYVNVVYFGVASHFDEIEKKISELAEKFEVKRIYKADMAVLVLACYEIMFMDSIPYKVSVDEALRLAEIYSTEKSVKYINGILSKLAR